jgi:hypothetical protein
LKAPAGSALVEGGNRYAVVGVRRRPFGGALRVASEVARKCIVAAVIMTAWLTIGVPVARAAAPFEFGGPEGSGAGELNEPKGIAVAQESGDVFVADRNNRRISEFGPDGEFLLSFGWGVKDGTTETLQTCGPEATPPTAGCAAGIPGDGAGQFGPFSAEGIAVDNDLASPSHGDIYVVDAQNSRIEKFGPAGEFLLAFGSEGTGPGQFERLNGRSVAVGSNGAVYVGDENRVQRFSPSGEVEAQIPIAGAGSIENLAIDSAGDLYVKGSALPGVRKYDQTGTELGAPRDEAGPGESQALTVGPADQLVINDGNSAETHHLLTYDSSGVQLSSFDSGLEGGGRGIAYSEALGGVYVLNPSVIRAVAVPPPGPLVVPGTEAATEIEPTTATLGATVNPEGPEPTSYRFEFGTSASYGQSSPSPPAQLLGGNFEDQKVVSSIPNLQPDTVYDFRVVVESAVGETTFGSNQEFVTLPPVSIDSVSASAVTATTTTLETQLNPHGLESEFRFEYGPTTAYGRLSPEPDGRTGDGDADVSRIVQIQGLNPGTTYHYRVVAHNSLGTTRSEDHTLETQGSLPSVLPDGRVWELVSPPDKHGSPLEPITEGGGIIQAATDGSGLAYVANGPVTTEPAGDRSPVVNQLLAKRGPEGWDTQDITSPHEKIDVVRPAFPSEYKSFSETLSAAVVEPQGATRLAPTDPANTERTPYRRQAGGEYVPLVNATNVFGKVKFGGVENPPGGGGLFDGGVTFESANPDAGTVLLSSPLDLTAGFEGHGQPSLYAWTNGILRPVSILPDGESAGAAGLHTAVGTSNGEDQRGAVSAEGTRVIFTASEGSFPHLYLRDIPSEETVQLDVVQGGAGGTGEVEFQGANSDATKVFFTDSARLTSDSASSPGKPDLYMCEIKTIAGSLTCSLQDLTVSAIPGEPADVQQTVSAFSEDGRYVYFVADGVLAPGAIRGTCLVEDTSPSCNYDLYVRDTDLGQTHLVAVLSRADGPDWGTLDGLGKLTARTSPNGKYLAFMSERPLTGYDNHDARSGSLDEEVFLFSVETGRISCVSCNPTGARPLGVFDPGQTEAFPGLLVDHPRTWGERWIAGSIPGWTLYGHIEALYQSRFLSDSGRTFFNSSDALAPQDSNGVEDVYEYEPPGVGDCSTSSATFVAVSGGCVSLISSGTSKEESAFLDASENGNDVFFLTSARLSRTDVDSASDIYDASVGGHTVEPSTLIECAGDGCQQPAVPPSHPTPGTALLDGPGNVLQCPKGKVKRKGKCAKTRQQTKSKKHQKKHDKKPNRKGKKQKRTGAHKKGGSK